MSWATGRLRRGRGGRAARRAGPVIATLRGGARRPRVVGAGAGRPRPRLGIGPAAAGGRPGPDRRCSPTPTRRCAAGRPRRWARSERPDRRSPRWPGCSTTPAPRSRKPPRGRWGRSAPAAADAVPALVPPPARPRRVGPPGRGRGRRPHRHADRGRRPTPLVEGLASPDTVVRARTAEALGHIGEAAEDAAPALVEALTDDNDRVRAKAVEALGKIGEAAADVAPSPAWSGRCATRTTGSAPWRPRRWARWASRPTEAVPALVRSLRHINPQVRAQRGRGAGQARGDGRAPQGPALERRARGRGRRRPLPGRPALGEVGSPDGASPETPSLVARGRRRPAGAGRRRRGARRMGRAGRRRPPSACWPCSTTPTTR